MEVLEKGDCVKAADWTEDVICKVCHAKLRLTITDIYTYMTEDNYKRGERFPDGDRFKCVECGNTQAVEMPRNLKHKGLYGKPNHGQDHWETGK